MISDQPTSMVGYTYIAHEGHLALIMREIGTSLSEDLYAEDRLKDLSHIEGPRYKVTVTVELA